ncbi:uncharacterized protein LOC121378521 isoform X2 [Gigantopelta aegis]|uniref:uncharacterized protein LOC121378521 isoform X2 n=1 Tax=Gigantopelta aegis TaxID=1735272 RepID=UPI001B88D47A|nr:uncharacterized protein LOC121378521 isoform X2 [Gigantopelta aegis]
MVSDVTGLVVAAVIVAVIVFILVVAISCYCWRRIEYKRERKGKKKRSSSMVTSSTALGHPPYTYSPYCVPTTYKYPPVPPAMHLAAYQPQYIPAYNLPGLVMSGEDRASPRYADFKFTEAVYISQPNGDVPRENDLWKYDRPKPRRHPDWLKKSYEETGKILNIGDDEKSKHSSIHSKKMPAHSSNVQETKTVDEFMIVDYVTTGDAPASSPVYTAVIKQRETSSLHKPSASPPKSPPAPSTPPPSPPPPPDPIPVAVASYSTRQEVRVDSVLQETEVTKDTETEEYLLSYRQRRPKEGTPQSNKYNFSRYNPKLDVLKYKACKNLIVCVKPRNLVHQV